MPVLSISLPCDADPNANADSENPNATQNVKIDRSDHPLVCLLGRESHLRPFGTHLPVLSKWRTLWPIDSKRMIIVSQRIHSIAESCSLVIGPC